MSNNKKRILIVDDAQFTRNILKKIISKTGYCEVVGEKRKMEMKQYPYIRN